MDEADTKSSVNQRQQDNYKSNKSAFKANQPLQNAFRVGCLPCLLWHAEEERCRHWIQPEHCQARLLQNHAVCREDQQHLRGLRHRAIVAGWLQSRLQGRLQGRLTSQLSREAAVLPQERQRRVTIAHQQELNRDSKLFASSEITFEMIGSHWITVDGMRDSWTLLFNQFIRI